MSKKHGVQKIWIVSELFYPDETSTSFILTKIANKLCEKYDVNVISSSSRYNKSNTCSSSAFIINDAITINRVSGFNLDKNNVFSRLIRLVSLTFSLFFALLRRLKSKDKVLIVTNPAPLLILISFLRAFKKFDFIILVHDIFPENTIPAGILKSPSNILYRILKFFFDKAYGTADSLIVLGRDMKDIIVRKISNSKKACKIVIIENWADVINIFPCERDVLDELADKVVFQYAGNIGRVQGLLALLESIRIANNPNICFFFIGDGAVKQVMEDYVGKYNLKNIYFQGSYARDEQNLILNNCDIAIITLAERMYGLGVPSKTYNILAAGKPILFIGNKKSEIGQLVEETGNGFCFEPQEKDKLISFLQSLSVAQLPRFAEMGEVSRRLAEEEYSENIILNKFLEAI